MYNTGDERAAKKLHDLRSKDQILLQLLRDQDGDKLLDGSGLFWEFSLTCHERVNSESARSLSYELVFVVRTVVTGLDLVRTGTLDPDRDQRLLSLIEGESIPLAMRPVSHHAHSMEEARSIVRDELIRLKAKLCDPKLEELKRRLVGKWVEKITIFGRLDPLP